MLNPGNALDLGVLSLMRDVQDKAERVTHRFGVLVGHGELSPSAPELFGGSGPPLTGTPHRASPPA